MDLLNVLKEHMKKTQIENENMIENESDDMSVRAMTSNYSECTNGNVSDVCMCVCLYICIYVCIYV